MDAVAAAQSTVSRVTADDASLVTGMPPAVTVRGSDGTLVTVQPTSGSLQDIARAINNAADAGVKATVVRVSGGVEPTYRLQFTGTATGGAGSFAVYAGTADEVTAAVDAGDGGAALAALRLDTTTVRAASDAQITLWKGTAAEQTFVQSSNTFAELLTGVDVTVSKVSGPGDEPVAVNVQQDTVALTKLVSGLVGSMGVVLSEIGSRTATTTKTNADGTRTVTGGLFSGDSAVRGGQQALVNAMLSPADGSSPSAIGITYGRDGSFAFDETVFLAALADDPAKVQSMASQIAQRVATVADGLANKYDGSLTTKITSQQSLVKDYGTQIDNWDRRLA
ncbi:MAG TPA: flagellar filament capping protein FliD, partial [Actinotalea sp.]|nr:flagellar filament capping protein FliD [Actinotalea sp.]